MLRHMSDHVDPTTAAAAAAAVVSAYVTTSIWLWLDCGVVGVGGSVGGGPRDAEWSRIIEKNDRNQS